MCLSSPLKIVEDKRRKDSYRAGFAHHSDRRHFPQSLNPTGSIPASKQASKKEEEEKKPHHIQYHTKNFSIPKYKKP